MDAACATCIVQLATAVALVESGAANHVLLTQSHLLLRVMEMLHPATPGLGDGATAFVVSRERRWPVLATYSRTSGEFHRAVTWVRGNTPETDHPWWKEGGDYRLGSRSLKAARRLMRDTVSIGSQTVREVCEQARVDPERIDLLASVQPRAWIPGAIAEHVGLPADAAVHTYEQYAHVGACGPIANWHHAVSSGHPAQLVALYAQGAGFTRGAALISMDSAA
jgi:3-oxoacyl-[acyl-carrier-protein] synthase III